MNLEAEFFASLDVLGWTCIVGFSILLLGTVLGHLHYFGSRDFRDTKIFRLLNGLYLLPQWNFFAPNPGTNSYVVLAREFYEEGQASSWVEIPVAPHRSRQLQFLWNPHGRLRKAMLDVVADLTQTSFSVHDEEPERRQTMTQLTTSYIKCLMLATEIKKFSKSSTIQFAIFECHMNEDPRIFLISKKHRV